MCQSVNAAGDTALSAVLASGDSRAVASHLTAAAFHQIAVPDVGGGGHITVPASAGAGRDRDTVAGQGRHAVTIHVATLPDADVVVGDGDVAVTTPERTLLDLTAVLPRLDAVWALDDALRRGVADAGTLCRCLQRAAGAVDESVQARLSEADGMSRSMLETAARLALRDGGVPLPVPHYRINDGSGHVATVDAAYPWRRLALQFRPPSAADAAGPAADARRCRLAAMGWTVLRFSWWDVRYATADFVHQVRSTLTAAA